MKYKEITLEDIIRKSKERFGNLFNYDKCVYVNPSTPMTFICERHGEFKQMPYYHLTSNGCPRCSKETTSSLGNPPEKIHIKLPEPTMTDMLLNPNRKNSGRKRLSQDDFIKRSINTHGKRYDYSMSVYKTSGSKVDIICKEHGLFSQIAGQHMKGAGCRKCGEIIKTISKSSTKESFIEKSKKIHGDLYNYKKVKYVNSFTRVKIICKEHGVFEQTPRNHLDGSGCNKCGIERQKELVRLGLKDFIIKSNKVHDHLYDYSKTEYIDTNTKVKIICEEHGVFEQKPFSHLQGYGCKECSDGGRKHTKEKLEGLLSTDEKPKTFEPYLDCESCRETIRKELILELKEEKRKKRLRYKLWKLIPVISFNRE